MEFSKYELYDLLNRPGPLWLAFADLSGANLNRANLKGADLTGANLAKTNLDFANLQGAYLDGTLFIEANLRAANLQDTFLNGDVYGAKMGGVDLTGAEVDDGVLLRSRWLIGATMSDGKRYDGRYRLPGDLEMSRKEGFDTSAPVSMAQFYQVSLEEYLQGQKWADENIARFKPDS